MSRRRTGTRYVPITISLTPSLVNDIEAMLRPKQSRSQWIAGAIRKKLEGEDAGTLVGDASSKQLLLALVNRGVITYSAMEILIASTDEHSNQE